MSSERVLLTEPITRSDGMVIIVSRDDDTVFLQEGENPSECSLTSCYAVEEVKRLGLGDFQVGVARLGQAAFSELEGHKTLIDIRLFDNELRHR